jgi:hypothetical protein
VALAWGVLVWVVVGWGMVWAGVGLVEREWEEAQVLVVVVGVRGGEVGLALDWEGWVKVGAQTGRCTPVGR